VSKAPGKGASGKKPPAKWPQRFAHRRRRKRTKQEIGMNHQTSRIRKASKRTLEFSANLH